MKNTNSKFLEKMNEAISIIGENRNELKTYLNTNIDSKEIKEYEKLFKDEVDKLSTNLDKELEVKQKILDSLKQKFKCYYENILLVYENIFIKTIKKYNQKLNDLINKIIIEFEPPKENSLYIDKNIDISTSGIINEFNDNIINQETSSNDFYSSDNNNNNDNNENNVDNEQNKEIDYFCSFCDNKKEAIYLCHNNNLLFCQECFEDLNIYNERELNTQKLSDMKSHNEKGKILYLNSLKHFIKSIIIKSNYLLNSEIIKSKSSNDSKIEYIKRIYFKYPFLEKINDFNSQLNFLIDINNILTTNYEIENLDSQSFSINNIDKKLVNLIESLFMDDPYNYKMIVKNVKNINFEEEEEEEGNYKDEDYIKKNEGKRKIAQYKFNNSIENMFYYVINLIPRESVSYDKKSLTSSLLDGITKQFGIKKDNIYFLFGEKKYFVNCFIKTNKFSSISLEKIKNLFQNEYEKIYEYKKIYENIGSLINKEYLDCRGNTISPNSSNNLFRGTKEYYPPYGWIGIGLKVLDLYGEKNWLEDTSKYSKWAIAYLTISSNKILSTLKNFLTKNGLKEDNNKKKNKNKRNYDKSIGEDLYLTPYIDSAERYTGYISLNNKNYKIALMAKVLISNIKETNDENYWRLNKKDVRIYRILLKEV